MRKFIWLLAALGLLLWSGPARADFEFTDLACETTTTAGTGTVNLDGALTGGYLSFLAAGIDSGDTIPYTIKNGSQLETGRGTFTDAAPDTLSRTAFLSTDGPGAELTLSGSTTVCIGPTTEVWTAGVAMLDLATLGLTGSDGTTTYGGIAAQLTLETTSPTTMWGQAQAAYSNDATGPAIAMFKSRNAAIAGHTVVQDGDHLFEVYGFGSDGTNFEYGAAIHFEVDGTPASGGDTTDMPGRITLRTTPDGTATLVDQWILDNAGTFKPATDNADDIGTSALGVKDVYVTNNLEMGGDTSNSLNCTGGECTIEGDKLKQAGKQTIWVPAAALTSNTTNGCATATNESSTNDVMFPTCNFDTTTQESAQFNVRFPANWNEGTVSAVFYWSHPSTATNFGVEWDIACLASDNDDALDTAFGTAIEVGADTGGTTDDLYETAETGAVTCAGTPTAGDLVTFRVRRVPADGSDTLAVDARLHGVALFYTDDDANDD